MKTIEILSFATIFFCVIMAVIYPELTYRMVPCAIWTIMLMAGLLGGIWTWLMD